MSVISISTALGNLMTDYNAKLEGIQKNKDISADYMTRQANQLFRDTLPEAERLTKSLWGDVTDDGSGRYILSENGAVWAAMIAAEKAQFEGKQRFLSSRYKNPELLPILAARINSKMRACMNGYDFLRAYEAMSTDERNYCQDLGEALFNGMDGRDWSRARAQIAVDLKASESAVFDPLQEAVNATVRDAWEFGLPAYRAAANAFGRESYYIQSVAKGIHSQSIGMGYAVDRQPWGVIFVNQGRITKYEAPSDLFPKARRIGK